MSKDVCVIKHQALKCLTLTELIIEYVYLQYTITKFATRNMVQGPAALTSPESLLALSNLRPRPKPSQSEPAFC